MDLKKAKEILAASSATCVLCKGEQMISSQLRGVAPLMQIWEAETCVAGFSAADKVVGKATALLYCLLKVRAVHAGVMSRPALEVLASHGIAATYDNLVDAIQNRSGDGFCPMETATRHITDPKDAPDAIRAALQKLKNA